MPRKRYVVLPSFLTPHEQVDLTNEVIQCHLKTSDSFQAVHATASIRINLGISCGESVHQSLPLALHLARRAFAMARAALVMPVPNNSDDNNYDDTDGDDDAVLQRLASSTNGSLLTGLALLYGPSAKMTPHFDSPTQPNQRHEWLVMFTIGNAVDFICNDDILTLVSGDALVMDSMAVLHGVRGIRQEYDDGGGGGGGDCNSNGPTVSLPLEGSRLGVLLWQARSSPTTRDSSHTTADAVEECIDGVHMLFQQDLDNDDE